LYAIAAAFGTQMGGCFRKETTALTISTAQVRSADGPAKTLSSSAPFPADRGGDIYPALEKGTIDALNGSAL